MIKGIGTDIVEISRIEKMDLDKLANKILNSKELENTPISKLQSASHLAKRFAAKEAISKAYGTGIGNNLSFKDIIISSHETGKPLAEIIAKDLKIHLSISDEKNYAVAFAIIEN